MTSPVAAGGGGGVVTSKSCGLDESTASAAQRRQPAPLAFGNVLSSVQREVESTLRQFQNTDSSGTAPAENSGAAGAATLTTSATSTPLLALSSTSPCMRDVCDAIIVQALQQSDLPQHDAAAAAGLDPHRSESSESSQQKSCWTDVGRTWPSDSRSQRQQQFGESKAAAHVPHAGGQQSRFLMGSKSDSSQCCEAQLREQVGDCKDKQSWSRITKQELYGEQSGATDVPREPKSCSPVSSVEKVLSRGGVDAATEDDGNESSRGVTKKTEADVSNREADDVDIEDQPLCIDLNRDASPDNEDDTVAQL